MSEQSKFIVIIRPEFMSFCKDACRSASFNHLLFRLAGKCKDQPKEKIQGGEILWYATTDLLVEEMSDAWKVCKVRQEVNALVNAGLIGRTSNPSWGQDRTKHFFFGKEQCARFVELCEQQHICVVHLDLPAEVKHLIYSSLAFDKSIKCSCPDGANDESIGCKSYIHPMHSINSSLAFDKSIEALTKNTTKINTKNNNEDKEDTKASSDASHRASLSSDPPMDDVDNTTTAQPALPDVTPQSITIAPELATDTPTVLKASVASYSDTEALPPNKQASYSPQETTHKPAKVEKPTKEPSGPPQMPPADMPWGTRKCLQKYDAKRGAPLIVKHQLQQASAIAKGMAENYSEQDVDRVTTAMDADPFYAGRGGVDIFDVGRNIAKYLKMLNQQGAAKAIVKTGTDMEEAKARAEAKNREQLEKMRARQAKLQAQKGA